MSELNIYQRVNKVMADVEYVKKDAKVQGYAAVTHDMVTATLRGSMVKHGIVVQLEQKSSEILERRDKAAGVSMMLYSGTYDVHFVNIDKPEDRATITLDAHAADNGDKAPGKCASYATKHAMLKLFSLETGENDESRVEHLKTLSDDELDKLTKAIKDAGKDDAYMIKKAGVASLDQLPRQRLAGAMNHLAGLKKDADE
jgi:hypothetical protein